jgi:hypothetical protein
MRTTVSIRGVNRSTLWSAWKEVRRQLKRAPRRDVLDYLEYDIDPDVWIGRLLKRLATGDYSPERPQRYSLAKSKGFDRVITVSAIPDVVLYRTIVDYLFRRGRKNQCKHAYFCQATLSKVVDEAATAARGAMATAKARDESPYTFTSRGAFLEWLKFDQYRKLLIFDKVYPFIVVTDITNFFDSVLYGRIEESLYGLPASPRLISLLFLLLESFSLREAFTPVQRIGLPVDPCDCSRVLAHMILFPHDDRITRLVGEDAYVRWMDDQNMGVKTRAEGLRVLGEVCDSLRRLHLTTNSGKSKILSLAEAKKHFHFVANGRLDLIDKLPHSTQEERRELRKAVLLAWNKAKALEGVGEWQKVLKRLYRHAARARSKLFVRRAVSDIKKFPGLVDRVSDYIRYVCDADDVVSFVAKLLNDPEQVYPDVNFQLIECLLKLDSDAATAKRLCKFATAVLNDALSFPGAREAKALAPILILRYGDRRNLRILVTKLKRDAESLPSDVTRALCAVVGGDGTQGFTIVRNVASRLLRNHLSEFVKLVGRIRQFDNVPGRFKSRVAHARDSITGASFIDMRSLLAARILGLSNHAVVRVWLATTKKNLLASAISDFDRRLLSRLWPTSAHGN